MSLPTITPMARLILPPPRSRVIPLDMKLFFKLFLGLFAFILFSFLGAYAYLGGFHSVKVSKGSMDGFNIVYTTHTGSYEGLSKSWNDFRIAWTKAGLKECRSLGIYLDPPDTPADKLRSILACNVTGMDDAQLGDALQAFPRFEVPSSQALLSDFPFVNEMSFFLASMKVYPKMHEVIKADNITPTIAIEIYGKDENFEKIKFAMPTDASMETFAPLAEAFSE